MLLYLDQALNVARDRDVVNAENIKLNDDNFVLRSNIERLILEGQAC